MLGEDRQHPEERPGLVADGQHDRRPGRLPVTERQRRQDRAGSGDDQEPGPVVVDVLDPVGQDLEPEQRRRPRRQDRRRAALRAVDDEPARAGRVVGRQQRPRPGPQERLGLAERLDVRVDPVDLVEPLAGQGGEAQPDRDDDLGPKLEIVLEEQVVVLADRAVDAVLDRDDPADRSCRAVTSSKTWRKPGRPTRSTSPNAARTASSANAPGSPE